MMNTTPPHNVTLVPGCLDHNQARRIMEAASTHRSGPSIFMAPDPDEENYSSGPDDEEQTEHSNLSTRTTLKIPNIFPRFLSRLDAIPHPSTRPLNSLSYDWVNVTGSLSYLAMLPDIIRKVTYVRNQSKALLDNTCQTIQDLEGQLGEWLTIDESVLDSDFESNGSSFQLPNGIDPEEELEKERKLCAERAEEKQSLIDDYFLATGRFRELITALKTQTHVKDRVRLLEDIQADLTKTAEYLGKAAVVEGMLEEAEEANDEKELTEGLQLLRGVEMGVRELGGRIETRWGAMPDVDERMGGLEVGVGEGAGAGGEIGEGTGGSGQGRQGDGDGDEMDVEMEVAREIAALPSGLAAREYFARGEA